LGALGSAGPSEIEIITTHYDRLQNRAVSGKKPYTFSRLEARAHILHNFRKSFASYAMLQGTPVRNIQRDLGHSKMETTERYLAVVEEPDKVRKAYAAIK
jgi:site-specific recombinase XerD